MEGRSENCKHAFCGRASLQPAPPHISHSRENGNLREYGSFFEKIPAFAGAKGIEVPTETTEQKCYDSGEMPAYMILHVAFKTLYIFNVVIETHTIPA